VKYWARGRKRIFEEDEETLYPEYVRHENQNLSEKGGREKRGGVLELQSLAQLSYKYNFIYKQEHE
jgi:hypothetical protein